MILVTISKEKDGSFTVNRWVKFKGAKLKRTHDAFVQSVSAEQVQQFYLYPPERLANK